MNTLHLDLARVETARRVADAELRRQRRAATRGTRPVPRRRSIAE